MTGAIVNVYVVPAMSPVTVPLVAVAACDCGGACTCGRSHIARRAGHAEGRDQVREAREGPDALWGDGSHLNPIAVPLVSPDMNGSVGQEWPSSVNDYMYGDHRFPFTRAGMWGLCGLSVDRDDRRACRSSRARGLVADMDDRGALAVDGRPRLGRRRAPGGRCRVSPGEELGRDPVRHQVRQLHRPGPIRSRLLAQHAAGQGGGDAPSARRG